MNEGTNPWKGWRIPLAVAMSLAILICVYVFKRRDANIDLRTNRLIHAALDGDIGLLMAHEPEASIKIGGMSEAKLRQVYDKLIRPYLKGWSIEHEIVGEENSDPSLGMSYLDLRHTSGKQLQFGRNLSATDVGPRDPCLWHLLNFSWKLRFGDANAEPYEQVLMRRLRGLREDREFLESTGLRGTLNGEWTALDTWDEKIKRWEARLAGVEIEQ